MLEITNIKRVVFGLFLVGIFMGASFFASVFSLELNRGGSDFKILGLTSVAYAEGDGDGGGDGGGTEYEFCDRYPSHKSCQPEPPTCPNGTTNHPYCNQCPDGKVFKDGKCVNPPCPQYPNCHTPPPPQQCQNGATNYPYCNNNNHCNNYPNCNTCPAGQYFNGTRCVTNAPQSCANNPYCYNNGSNNGGGHTGGYSGYSGGYGNNYGNNVWKPTNQQTYRYPGYVQPGLQYYQPQYQNQNYRMPKTIMYPNYQYGMQNMYNPYMIQPMYNQQIYGGNYGSPYNNFGRRW